MNSRSVMISLYCNSGQMNRRTAFRELQDTQFRGDSIECSASYPEIDCRNALEGQLCHQDFHYFVVIDFEATCDKEKIPDPQEIIEFPSVIVEATTGEIVATFQVYVRPTFNQQLSDFCKDLTGIQQNQVDRGVSVSEAILHHDDWLANIGVKKTKFAVVTWSNWDCKVMLESECRYKNISKPSYFNQWINLRVPFNEVFGGVKCTLKRAVETAGLHWMGRAHCGLDDAINTARLLAVLMRRGVKISITDSLSLMPELENQPFPLYKPDKKVETSVYPRCFCGVVCQKRTMNPGGKSFFACGNLSAAATRSHCRFLQFETP